MDPTAMTTKTNEQDLCEALEIALELLTPDQWREYALRRCRLSPGVSEFFPESSLVLEPLQHQPLAEVVHVDFRSPLAEVICQPPNVGA